MQKFMMKVWEQNKSDIDLLKETVDFILFLYFR